MVLFGLLTFINGLHGPFLIDDRAFFDQEGVDWQAVAKAFLPHGTRSAYYRPIADAFPLLNHMLFGEHTFGYHLVNLLLWVLAAFCLYIFLRRLFACEAAAFWASLFYLVHPINGVAVNYVTASVFSLEVIFMLLSLHFLCRPLLCTVFFILAMMCHESAIALPLYALALTWITRRCSVKEALQSAVPLFIAAALYFAFLCRAGGGGIFFNFIHTAGALSYLASLVSLVAWYLSRLVYPEGITLMRACLPVTGAAIGIWFGIFIFSVVAGAGLCYFWRRRPARLLGLAWLTIGFMPMIVAAAVTPAQGILIEPHWFIFSVAGFFMLLGDTVAPSQSAPQWQKTLLAVALALVWILSSWGYNKVWSNEPWYCEVWNIYNPDYKPSAFFLANAYTEHGEYDKARSYYRQCLMGRRKDWIVYTSIGHIDAMQGKMKDAEENLKHALTIEPRGLEAWLQLAMLYEQEQRLDLAAASLAKAQALNPKDSRVLRHMAEDNGRQGKYEISNDLFSKANALLPCGNKIMTGWLRMAIASRDKDLRLGVARRAAACSSNPAVLTMAGSVFGFYGFYDKALPLFDKALSIDPRFSDARVEAAKWRVKQTNTLPGSVLTGRLPGSVQVKHER